MTRARNFARGRSIANSDHEKSEGNDWIENAAVKELQPWGRHCIAKFINELPAGQACSPTMQTYFSKTRVCKFHLWEILYTL